MKKITCLLSLILFIVIFTACKKSTEFEELPVTYESFKGITNPGTSNYSIYPKPFGANLNIDLSGTEIKLQLSDEEGRVKNIELERSGNIVIDFSNCESGIYYCEIILDGVVYRERLWKNQ